MTVLSQDKYKLARKYKYNNGGNSLKISKS